MNGGVLSAGSPLATAGFTTPLPIISTPQVGLQFSEPIEHPRLKMETETDKRERRTRHKHDKGLRRARRNNRKELCRMYSSGAGSYLRIHHNGSVDGEKSTHPGELSIVQFIGIAHVIGLVKIKGVLSNNYLCMNDKGQLYARSDDKDECIFREHLEDNNYNYYSSKKHNPGGTKFWFVALNKNGTTRSAKKSRMDQKFTKFLLNNCKKIKETPGPGPFSIGQLGKLVPTSPMNVKPPQNVDEGKRDKGRGRKRCKGKKGRRCRKHRKNKKDRENKDEDETTAQPETSDVDKVLKFRPSLITDPCKRKWRNRKMRSDYKGEAHARRQRRKCRRRQRKRKRQERLEKLANSTAATPTSTISAQADISTSSPVLKISTQKPVTSTAEPVTQPPPIRDPTEAVQDKFDQIDLSHSDRFSAAKDFRSVFDNLVKAIQINNQELLSNFSSVEEKQSLARLLRSGRLRHLRSGQSGFQTAGSGATPSEHVHRHHHGEGGRRRQEREVSPDMSRDLRIQSEIPSGSDRDSETGYSGEGSGAEDSQLSASERTSPATQAKMSKLDLMRRIFLHTFGGKSSQERTWPDGSALGLNSDNYRVGIVVIREHPNRKTPDSSRGRRPGRRKSRRRSETGDEQS